MLIILKLRFWLVFHNKQILKQVLNQRIQSHFEFIWLQKVCFQEETLHQFCWQLFLRAKLFFTQFFVDTKASFKTHFIKRTNIFDIIFLKIKSSQNLIHKSINFPCFSSQKTQQHVFKKWTYFKECVLNCKLNGQKARRPITRLRRNVVEISNGTIRSIFGPKLIQMPSLLNSSWEQNAVTELLVSEVDSVKDYAA